MVSPNNFVVRMLTTADERAIKIIETKEVYVQNGGIFMSPLIRFRNEILLKFPVFSISLTLVFDF